MRVLLGMAVGVLLGSCASPRGRSAGVETAGEFRGDLVSFARDGGRVADFAVSGLACNGLTSAGQVCSGELDPKLVAGEGALDGSEFLVELGPVVVQGKVDGLDASGTVTFLVNGCCSVTEAWSASAEVEPPVGEPDPEDPGVVPPGTAGASTTPSGLLSRAITLVDEIRLLVGAPALTHDASITLAAQAHADYFRAHESEYASGKVPGGAHQESASFPEGFTGVSFADRMAKAGFKGSPSNEVIAFEGDPEQAIGMWMESVYHRIPFVSPDVAAFGYGTAPGIDVMDFSAGPGDRDLVVVYPVEGQTGVPRAWYGNESPQPPPPPKGYPSGTIITISVGAESSLTIDEHTLTGPNGLIAHTWMVRGTDAYLGDSWALYANRPLDSKTTYRVDLKGHRADDASWTASWSFTTGI